MDNITITGAREHNLKNINLTIPKYKLVVLTGLSGSGKSSLAFDTIYAEGQRRYVESLSAYARQFLGMMEKPDVDQIDGLSPAISIDQKTVSHNPRSTVGTTTEIYDYLRLLFARVGHPHCPNCGREIKTQTLQQITDHIVDMFSPAKKGKGTRLMVLAPLVKDRKGEYSALLDDLVRRGYPKARIDGRIFDLDEDDITLIKTNRHTIEVVVDRVVLEKGSDPKRLSNSVEKALKLANGTMIISKINDKGFDFPDKPTDFEDHMFSESFACAICNISLPEIEPRSFSFNNPHGACPNCSGLGTTFEVDASRVYNGELTIEEGGLFPWSRSVMFDSYPRRFLTSLATKYKFGFDTKIKDIPHEALEKILNDGIVPYLQRRYEESDSDEVRKKIEQY
ncbi:excinuclease ABC subunit UvrA, partial [candidate division WWE3 bacterium CG_4_9_14_3_um_filter_39_7]